MVSPAAVVATAEVVVRMGKKMWGLPRPPSPRHLLPVVVVMLATADVVVRKKEKGEGLTEATHALIIPLPIVIIMGVGIVIMLAMFWWVVMVVAIITIVVVAVVTTLMVVVVVDRAWELFCICLWSHSQIQARVIFITLF